MSLHNEVSQLRNDRDAHNAKLKQSKTANELQQLTADAHVWLKSSEQQLQTLQRQLDELGKRVDSLDDDDADHLLDCLPQHGHDPSEQILSSLGDLREKIHHLESGYNARFENEWEQLSQRIDNRLNGDIKDLMLGTLQSAITPFAEFTAERILTLEKRLLPDDAPAG